MVTNFDYLKTESKFSAFADAAIAAEKIILMDPEASIINCRRAMEFAVKWMYSVDTELEMPYRDNLQSLMNAEEYRQIVGQDIWKRMDYIRRCGNNVAHSNKKLGRDEAMLCLENLFIYLDYIAYCYSDQYQEHSFDREIIAARIEQAKKSKEAANATKKELEKDSIMSYNAGIIGGNDLEFIAEYCRTAFNFIESNHLNDINSKDIHINNNILFEQILFYAQSNSYNKPVATVLDHSVRDNGYIYDDFCNFYLYDKAKLLHIIGGHKKNQRICDLLSKTLLNKYPDYYNRVVELFANNHKRMQNKAKNTTFPDLSVQMCIASYQDYLHSLSKKWEKLSYTDLYDWEKCSSSYFMFLNAGKEEQAIFTINRNPYLSIYEIPEPWPTEAKKLLKERINKECHSDHFDIVCIPCLLYEGFKEVLINDLCYNILILIEEEKTFECLFNELLPCFSSEISKDKEQTYKLILTEVEYLLYHGVICIN